MRLLWIASSVVVLAIAAFLFISRGEPSQPGLHGDVTNGANALALAAAPPEQVARPASLGAHVDGTGSYLKADARLESQLAAVNLAENIDALLLRADSDPVFAYALVGALQNCSVASFADDLALEHVQGVSEEDANRLAMEHNEHFKQCQGLSGAYAKERFDLVEQAASQGVLDAQINYRLYAADFLRTEEIMTDPKQFEDYKSNAIKFAERAARSKTPEGVYSAYDVMSNERFGNDPVKAHLYLSAYEALTGSASSQRLLEKSRQAIGLEAASQAEEQARRFLN